MFYVKPILYSISKERLMKTIDQKTIVTMKSLSRFLHLHVLYKIYTLKTFICNGKLVSMN